MSKISKKQFAEERNGIIKENDHGKVLKNGNLS
jgi:cbb3-type cytochrome oxidase subunit 3